MIPVPGFVASMIQKTHEGKMAKTEARVQAVTESELLKFMDDPYSTQGTNGSN